MVKKYLKEIITPGIRFNTKLYDQKRVLTPKQAYKNGSDWLVMGRPITEGEYKEKYSKFNRSLRSMIKGLKICSL